MSPTRRADRPRQYVLDANALVGLFEDREVTAAKVERLMEQEFYLVWIRKRPCGHNRGMSRFVSRDITVHHVAHTSAPG